MTVKRLSARSLLLLGTAVVAVLGVVTMLLVVHDRNETEQTVRAEMALERQRADLMAIPGVVGVRLAEIDGALAIAVDVDPDTPVSSDLPNAVDGVAVSVQKGPTEPSGGSAGGGSEPGFSGSGSVEPGSSGGDMGEPGFDGSGAEAPPSPPDQDVSASPAAAPPGSPGSDNVWLTLEGRITAVRADTKGLSLAFLLESATTTSGQAGYDKAWLRIDARTRFFDSAGRPTAVPAASALKGRRVRAGVSGAVRESYPVQATAAEVRLL